MSAYRITKLGRILRIKDVLVRSNSFGSDKDSINLCKQLIEATEEFIAFLEDQENEQISKGTN